MNFGVGEMIIAFGLLHDKRAGKNGTCVMVDIKPDDSWQHLVPVDGMILEV